MTKRKHDFKVGDLVRVSKGCVYVKQGRIDPEVPYKVSRIEPLGNPDLVEIEVKGSGHWNLHVRDVVRIDNRPRFPITHELTIKVKAVEVQGEDGSTGINKMEVLIDGKDGFQPGGGFAISGKNSTHVIEASLNKLLNKVDSFTAKIEFNLLPPTPTPKPEEKKEPTAAEILTMAAEIATRHDYCGCDYIKLCIDAAEQRIREGRD